MTQANYTVVTTYGREWNARAAAGEAVSPIKAMVFGDGDRAPTGVEVSLLNEVHRQAITAQGAYDDQTAAWFDTYLSAQTGGFVIREHGLVTEDGHLVAIGVRNPGIPKADPATGAADDFTYRIDIFFDQLDALVVQVDPIHGLTADRRIIAGDGLTGGGDLGYDRTFALDRSALLRPPVQKFILTSDHQENTDSAFAAAQVQMGQDAINDMIANHADATGVIFAGDLAHRGQPSGAEAAGYTEPQVTMADKRSHFERLPGGMSGFFPIPGNHDFNHEAPENDPIEGGTLAEYLRCFPASTYHVEIGNMVIIFMGDEEDSRKGNISLATIDWWEQIVLANQHSFIVTVTHQSLAGTILGSSDDAGKFIDNSDAFIERMTRAERPARVDLWLCGHHGTNSIADVDHRTAFEYGCRFVQVGLHIPSITNPDELKDPSYWTMELTDGLPGVVLRHWDMMDGAYIEANEIIVNAPAPMQLRALPQFDGRFQKHARHDRSQISLLALTAQLVTQTTSQEVRLRRLEGKPTGNLENAL